MGFVLKKVLDVSICLLNQCGCLRHDKEHTLREFHRQYRVCGEIGSGGFGRVYKAYRLSDGLPVAVKSIRHKRVNGWTMAERRMIPTEICFIEECQDVQGVVRFIGWFASRRGFLIVMERPANFMDLFDLISTFGWLEEKMARGLFVQIVDTVVELYKKHSVIHRDIKDENVVVDLDSGTVWLVDFGAAELLERAKKQRFQGTMSYSPPEVFKRDCFYPLEGTVWSLGILLYLLVVGKPPFRNELQICTGKLRFPRSVSSECRALIRRCLCPSPEGRISLEELQQNKWIRHNEPMNIFLSNFEAQWRRRKRHGSLNSHGVHALSDGDGDDDGEDEDCSYRTEAGAVPGPLTIPPPFGAHRSTTNSPMVEQHNNSSHSSAEEEGETTGAVQQKGQNSTSELAAADTRSSSSSSLAISEFGFETAPEYDEWKFASFSSSSVSDICDNAGAFNHKNFTRENHCSTLDHPNYTRDSQNDAFGRTNLGPSVSVPFVRIEFGATQLDRTSACSFCSSSSVSSDRGARRTSFTSDASFHSSTTYFSANSLENFFVHLNSSLDNKSDGEMCPSNSESENEEEKREDEDERTLRTEQPNSVPETWGREMSEDEDEWDETIRENIGSCVEQTLKDGEGRKSEEDEQIEKGQLDERRDGQSDDDGEQRQSEWNDQLLLAEFVEPFDEDEGHFEEDELRDWKKLAENNELLDDGQLLGFVELLEKDDPHSAAFPSSSVKWENGQLEDKEMEKANGNVNGMTFWLANGMKGQKRKGGDRYRRRRTEAKTTAGEEGPPIGTNFDRRRRRLTSPPVTVAKFECG